VFTCTTTHAYCYIYCVPTGTANDSTLDHRLPTLSPTRFATLQAFQRTVRSEHLFTRTLDKIIEAATLSGVARVSLLLHPRRRSHVRRQQSAVESQNFKTGRWERCVAPCVWSRPSTVLVGAR
jgi:hypothetical protein